jgi:putative two-component system response regulator
MPADSPSDPKLVLAQLRSTIASLGAIRQSSENASFHSSPDEVRVPSPTAIDEPPDEESSPVFPGSTGQNGPMQLDDELNDTEYVFPESVSCRETDDCTGDEMESGTPASDHKTGGVLREANKQARIMIVDDEPLNVMTFRQHLKQEGFTEFITTSDASQALGMIRKDAPDIVLLDINMPEVSGLEILRVVGLDPSLQHIPVLVLTAATDPLIRKRALDLGASDFLTKPIDPNELLPRVRNAIILKQHFDLVSGEATRLEQQVERRTRQLEATRQQLILSLARAAEHRDNDTGNHVLRVGRYTAIIAEELGYPKARLPMLEQAAQLHDVGKIGIPDSILFKPGKLEPAEYDLMKKHCALGKQIIEPISDKDWAVLKTHTRRGEALLHVRSSPLLMLAARIAQTHHEKWDGSGYPLGLAGEDIPLEGRIVAVADVYDALSSVRPYKAAFPREKCFNILQGGRGKHFDPQVLDAFFARSEYIVDTQMQLMDEEFRLTGDDSSD